MALQRQLRVLDTRDTDAGTTVARTLKVAFATDDLKHVNQHFGSAERFAIYAVESEKVTLLEVAEFALRDEGAPPPSTAADEGSRTRDGRPPAKRGTGVNENKLLEKFVLLEGCAAVYCQAVGGSAVRQLVQLGVQPIKVTAGMGIAVVLYQLQGELRSGPTGWLARACARLQDRKADRFDAMEADGWVE